MQRRELFGLVAAAGATAVATACGLEFGAGRTPLKLSAFLENEGKYRQNGLLVQLELDDNLILQTRTDIRRAVKEQGWLKVHGVKTGNRQVFEMAIRDSLSEDQKVLIEGFVNEANEIVIPSGVKLNLVGATFPDTEQEGRFAFDIQKVIPQTK